VTVSNEVLGDPRW